MKNKKDAHLGSKSEETNPQQLYCLIPRQETRGKKTIKGHYANQGIINQESLGTIDAQQFKKYPFHSHLVALKIFCSKYLPNCVLYGTGVVISGNLLLTSAHNLYDLANNRRMTHIECYIGVNGLSDRCYFSSEFYYLEQFLANQDVKYDYGLIKLKERIKQVANPNELALTVNCSDLGAEFSIYGYPKLDNYIERNNRLYIYQMGLTRSKKVKEFDFDSYVMTYYISTMQGQSGGAIISGPNKNLIVGIHKAGELFLDHNMGRMITHDMLSKLEEWRNHCEGDKFVIADYSFQIQKLRAKEQTQKLFEQLMLTREEEFYKEKEEMINEKRQELAVQKTEYQYQKRFEKEKYQKQIEELRNYYEKKITFLQSMVKQQISKVDSLEKRDQQLEQMIIYYAYSIYLSVLKNDLQKGKEYQVDHKSCCFCKQMSFKLDFNLRENQVQVAHSIIQKKVSNISGSKKGRQINNNNNSDFKNLWQFLSRF